jgi:hypothetical protein
VQADDAYNAGMQYTLRNIPQKLDEALRRKAKQEGKTLNQVAIDELSRALGINGQPVLHHDLDFMAGTWVEDPAFDEAIADFEKIDPEDWK